jgi:transcriptional regulator with XRE-family HTH domain
VADSSDGEDDGAAGAAVDDSGFDDGAGEVELLDVTELGRMLRERRGDLSLRKAAEQAKVSFSTFARVEDGAHPDLASFTRLCAWLRVSPSQFFKPVQEREVSPFEQALRHLKTDPQLSASAAEAISGVMRDLYAKLAQEIPPSRELVACHLRAKATLRPGVPQRLAGLLTDMHAELLRLEAAGQL